MLPSLFDSKLVQRLLSATRPLGHALGICSKTISRSICSILRSVANFGKIWPIRVHTPPVLGEVGQCWLEFGQHRAASVKFGANSAKFGRCRPMLRRCRPISIEFVQFRGKDGQCLANLAKLAANSTKGECAKFWVELGRFRVVTLCPPSWSSLVQRW